MTSDPGLPVHVRCCRCFSKLHEKLRKITLQDHGSGLAEFCRTEFITSTDEHLKRRLRLSVYGLCCALETERRRLMRGTAGRTSGNTDLRKSAVRDSCLSDGRYSRSERRLAVSDALLADRCADTCNTVLKSCLGSVSRCCENLLCLVCSQVDDIDRLMRCDPALCIRDLL